MSVKVTVKVYHCANGDGPFDGHIGFGIHSVNVNLMVTGLETVCVNGPLFLYQTLKDYVNTRIVVHKHVKTRLHSSRMRAARALTVSPSLLCTGGDVCSQGGLLQGGCLPM